MSECLVSEDGLHSVVDAPEWDEDDEFIHGGPICIHCGEEL